MTLGTLVRLVFLGVVLLAFASIAFGAVPDLPQRTELVCVPPGLPPYATWTPGEPTGVPLLMEDKEHRPYAILLRAYQAGGRTLHTWWLNGALVLVDPDPDNPDELGWADDGLVKPDMRARGADARPSCHFFKRTTPEEEKGDDPA